jgi:hypothetical protein
MGHAPNQKLFSARQRIRRWKSIAGGFHLLSVAACVFCLLWALPMVASKSDFELTQEWKEQQENRQMLVEALDRLVRYEHYFHDINGRFTRDLARLELPSRLASGDLEQLRRSFEISVIEVQPKRFLLLATGVKNTDRVTIDESHRLTANFPVPPPTRAYLLEEADRLLGLKAQGIEAEDGLFTQYWQITREEQTWAAIGAKQPVVGERRELQGEHALETIFEQVSERVKGQMGLPKAGGVVEGPAPASVDGADARASSELDGTTASLFKEVLTPSDVQEWLEAARLAQHVHKREHGHYAKRWEQLDAVSDYHFAERMRAVKNIRVHPIELSGDEREFHFTLEGTSGDLMGEQFVMDRTGSMRQVRYTEALIHQLQEGTNLLENAFRINPVEDSAGHTAPGKQ